MFQSQMSKDYRVDRLALAAALFINEMSWTERSFNLSKLAKTMKQISVNMTRFMITMPKIFYFRDV